MSSLTQIHSTKTLSVRVRDKHVFSLSQKAKSVLDAGWGILKTLLEYKCAHAGSVFRVVNEANTTQTCSSCREIPDSSPKGRIGLRIRAWTCSDCGATHTCRDTNGAKNILAVGLDRLAGEKVAAQPL